MKHTYLSPPYLAAPPPTERIPEVTPEKKFDADCTTFYVFNSGVTKPNLTKFPHDVEKLLPITILISKLRSTNPFRNASVPNLRRSSNFGRVAAQFSVSIRI